MWEKKGEVKRGLPETGGRQVTNQESRWVRWGSEEPDDFASNFPGCA